MDSCRPCQVSKALFTRNVNVNININFNIILMVTQTQRMGLNPDAKCEQTLKTIPNLKTHDINAFKRTNQGPFCFLFLYSDLRNLGWYLLQEILDTPLQDITLYLSQIIYIPDVSITVPIISFS